MRLYLGLETGHTDPEALKQALDKMPPLKVEMTLDPKAKVALAEGGKVTLADGSTVALKNGGVIDVRLPEIKLPDVSTASARTSDGTAIQRKVIVFNSVPDGPGRTVMTGWRYANGAAKIPSSQYCYLDHATLTGGEHTDLAFDRTSLPAADAALLSKCVWWSGNAG